MAVMAVRVRSRARAIEALLCFIGALVLLAVLMSREVSWFDAAYVGVAYALFLALSVRTLFSKWCSSEEHDVTKNTGLWPHPRELATLGHRRLSGRKGKGRRRNHPEQSLNRPARIGSSQSFWQRWQCSRKVR